MRVARVLSAEDVPEARKLLKITLSLGGDERRTVFAGIKQAYEPEQLVGRLVVLAANLAPRKMKFGTSEGMILAAGPGGEDVFLLGVRRGCRAGPARALSWSGQRAARASCGRKTGFVSQPNYVFSSLSILGAAVCAWSSFALAAAGLTVCWPSKVMDTPPRVGRGR